VRLAIWRLAGLFVAFMEGGDRKSQDSEVPRMGVSDNVVKSKTLLTVFILALFFKGETQCLRKYHI
jgi:hypothetical protein